MTLSQSPKVCSGQGASQLEKEFRHDIGFTSSTLRSAARLEPVLFAGIALSTQALAQSDPLPSWNEGPAKQAIISFVKDTTTQGNPKFLDPVARIATFDQDGTTWVEQPLYSQVMFAFHQVGVMAAADPKLKEVEPFKTVLSGDRAAIAKLTTARTRKNPRSHSHRHDGGSIQKKRTRLDRHGPRPAVSPSLHRSCVSADV